MSNYTRVQWEEHFLKLVQMWASGDRSIISGTETLDLLYEASGNSLDGVFNKMDKVAEADIASEAAAAAREQALQESRKPKK